MRKIVLVAALITVSACAKQTTVEKWDCSSKSFFADFFIDYENKTAGYGKTIGRGKERITRARINGNSFAFELEGETTLTVGKNSPSSGEFVLTGKTTGVLARGACERQ